MKFESKLVGEFFEMQKEIDRLFDSFTKSSSNVPTEAGLWQPPTDIYETADSFVVKMEVAGIKPGLNTEYPLLLHDLEVYASNLNNLDLLNEQQ